MNQEKISIKQLVLVMFAFEMGSSIIFALGPEAKRDAWLAVLIGVLFGFICISIYTRLSGYYPGKSFFQIIQKVLGKFVGFPLAITYIVYFISQAARICRDFSELILSTILIGTPSIVIILSFAAAIIYTLRGGIEVFGRMAEMIVPVVLLLHITMWIIIFASGVVDLKQLTPVLEGGIKDVWKATFPLLVSLPFGELIVFMMVWPSLNDQGKRIQRVGLAVVLAGGITLSLNIVGMLSVLGPHLYSRINYPLLAAVRMASIADFLERIDAIVILLMVAGGFFKVGAYLYAAAIGITDLFELKSYSSVLIPLGSIIVPLGLVMARNLVEHNTIGLKFLMTYVHLPLQFVIPSLLLVVAYFRNKCFNFQR